MWFQSKDENEVTKEDKKILGINFNLSEVARREFFQFKSSERVKFFRIFNKDCALKYKIEGDDTIVFIPMKNVVNKKGERYSPIGNDKIFTLEGITTWLATAINDIERVFSKRVVFNVMNEQTDSIILLRNGGRPIGDEDFEDMAKIEQRLVS